MGDFAAFDSRGYRTVDARTGYAEWAASYEQTVVDALDIDLLEELERVPWSAIEQAVDLGCGTGRTGTWLQTKGVSVIDGVDVTPEMLTQAREKGVYRKLAEAEVGTTGLPSGEYELVIACLVDEHLDDLRPLYDEAQRLARPGGWFVNVSYHPQFLMTSGIPTHYNNASGEPIAIDTHLHLLGEHVDTASAVGWRLEEMRERVIDDAWLAIKPQWAPFRAMPISAALVWHARGGTSG
jgi:SAM-dependent methyltransferase